MAYAKLTASFNRAQGIRKNMPLNDHELRQHVPSIFANDAHESRSSRYVWVPTAAILKGLQREGWEPFMAIQAKTRDKSRIGHTKHMIRLRRTNDIGKDETPEVILINSHDGSTSYQLFAGILRFVCTNSLVAGSNFQDVRVHHKGNIQDDVIEGVYTVAREFPRLCDRVAEFRETRLTSDEETAFAQAALMIRYEDEDAPIKPSQILKPQRAEDSSNNLWTSFNKIQEHMMRGGLRGLKRNDQGQLRRSRTRAITGIDQNTQLNRALWTLTEHMATLKNG